MDGNTFYGGASSGIFTVPLGTVNAYRDALTDDGINYLDDDDYWFDHWVIVDLPNTPTTAPTQTKTPEPTVAPTQAETPQPTVTPTQTETPQPTVTPTLPQTVTDDVKEDNAIIKIINNALSVGGKAGLEEISAWGVLSGELSLADKVSQLMGKTTHFGDAADAIEIVNTVREMYNGERDGVSGTLKIVESVGGIVLSPGYSVAAAVLKPAAAAIGAFVTTLVLDIFDN